MVKVTVIMDKLGKKPVAVVFSDHKDDIKKLMESVGGTVTMFEVPFWLPGDGMLMSEAAKVLDEKEKREKREGWSRSSGISSRVSSEFLLQVRQQRRSL